MTMFVHANGPDDLKSYHLEHRESVLLVDAVVNSGETVVDFAERIHKLHITIGVLVVTSVVRNEALTGPLQLLDGHVGLKLATLRISENKFTGKKGTDIGDRLFNITRLD